MSAPVALSVRELGKRYGEREALRSIDLELLAGERVGVIGPNGAGKTTLLSIVAGIQAPDRGSVDLADAEVGWVPQQPALYGKLSVAENLRLFARLERVGDVEAAVAAMLEQTGLADRADERVQRLSGGNRQRVNVAIGLLGKPAVIVLDEPSTALDPTQRRRLWEFVRALTRQGTAALFSTHIVAEAARHADRVLVLDEGQQVYLGSPAALVQRAGTAAGEDFESALVEFLDAESQP